MYYSLNYVQVLVQPKQKQKLDGIADKACISRLFESALVGYPSCLTWKGGIYTSHLAPLTRDTVLVFSNEDASKLPFVIGSQMHIVAPTLPPEVANIYPLIPWHLSGEAHSRTFPVTN